MNGTLGCDANLHIIVGTLCLSPPPSMMARASRPLVPRINVEGRRASRREGGMEGGREGERKGRRNEGREGGDGRGGETQKWSSQRNTCTSESTLTTVVQDYSFGRHVSRARSAAYLSKSRKGRKWLIRVRMLRSSPNVRNGMMRIMACSTLVLDRCGQDTGTTGYTPRMRGEGTEQRDSAQGMGATGTEQRDLGQSCARPVGKYDREKMVRWG